MRVRTFLMIWSMADSHLALGFSSRRNAQSLFSCKFWRIRGVLWASNNCDCTRYVFLEQIGLYLLLGCKSCRLRCPILWLPFSGLIATSQSVKWPRVSWSSEYHAFFRLRYCRQCQLGASWYRREASEDWRRQRVFEKLPAWIYAWLNYA